MKLVNYPFFSKVYGGGGFTLFLPIFRIWNYIIYKNRRSFTNMAVKFWMYYGKHVILWYFGFYVKCIETFLYLKYFYLISLGDVRRQSAPKPPFKILLLYTMSFTASITWGNSPCLRWSLFFICFIHAWEFYRLLGAVIIMFFDK